MCRQSVRAMARPRQSAAGRRCAASLCPACSGSRPSSRSAPACRPCRRTSQCRSRGRTRLPAPPRPRASAPDPATVPTHATSVASRRGPVRRLFSACSWNRASRCHPRRRACRRGARHSCLRPHAAKSAKALSPIFHRAIRAGSTRRDAHPHRCRQRTQLRLRASRSPRSPADAAACPRPSTRRPVSPARRRCHTKSSFPGFLSGKFAPPAASNAPPLTPANMEAKPSGSGREGSRVQPGAPAAWVRVSKQVRRKRASWQGNVGQRDGKKTPGSPEPAVNLCSSVCICGSKSARAGCPRYGPFTIRRRWRTSSSLRRGRPRPLRPFPSSLGRMACRRRPARRR